MEHLTALDASFLEAEDSDPHVSLAVGGVSVVAGPVPRYDELVSAFAERVRGIPRCTQILRTHPLDLGSPEWVDDPHFDISRHLYRVALPEPGDDAELFQMIANLMQHRLDRERPLWECWIIEGLTDNRWAMLMKLHHCIADGIATTQMLGEAQRQRRRRHVREKNSRRQGAGWARAASAPDEREPIDLAGRHVAYRGRRGHRRRTRRGGRG